MSPRATPAVATAAFRTAANGDDFAKRITDELNIPVRLISQAQEAELGFQGAVLSAGVDPERAVVWDVGGRSMQLSALGPDGKMMIFKGDLASGQMRDHVATVVQGKKPGASPNPMTREQADAAIAHAVAFASEEVPQAFRDRFADPSTIVIGIGALKYYGDRKASEPGASCSPKILQDKIDAMLGMTDAQIGGDYAASALTDRLLLLGFMLGLKVNHAMLADINLTDGLLFDPEHF